MPKKLSQLPGNIKMRQRRAAKKAQDAERAKGEFVSKVYSARNTAYFEQERRTVDPHVKRAVFDALEHMIAILLDRPYTPPRVTLGDVVKMESDIARQKKEIE